MNITPKSVRGYDGTGVRMYERTKGRKQIPNIQKVPEWGSGAGVRSLEDLPSFHAR